MDAHKKTLHTVDELQEMLINQGKDPHTLGRSPCDSPIVYVAFKGDGVQDESFDLRTLKLVK